MVSFDGRISELSGRLMTDFVFDHCINTPGTEDVKPYWYHARLNFFMWTMILRRISKGENIHREEIKVDEKQTLCVLQMKLVSTCILIYLIPFGGLLSGQHYIQLTIVATCNS